MSWFRRGAPPGSLETTLRAMADDGATGAISVVVGTPARSATIFLFQGRPYSAHLQDYDPAVASRLECGGRLDPEQAAALADEPAAVAGRIAVERGWVDADVLGEVHQEYVLASLGAILDAGPARVGRNDGATTARLCTLPLDLTALLETLRLRRERSMSTWASLNWGSDPTAIAVSATGAPLPQDLQVPEVTCLLKALSVPTALDVAAGSLGLTRAEVIHITAALARINAVTGSPTESGDMSEGLPVPEAFAAAAPTRAGWTLPMRR